MAHPIYSRQQLLNCGLVKVKKVAADLGVVPTGDKRLVQSWVDAIVEHQASKIQKIEIVEATIVFDDGLATCELAKYHVIVSGEIVHSVIAYAAAEGWVTRKGYTLVDSQTLAQNELEVEMEQQAVARADKFAQIESIYPNCDDPMGRTAYKKDYSSSEWYDVLVNNGFELEAKKHLQDVEMQSAATVEAESIKFISIDFGYHEAVAYGEVVATISTVFDRDTDNMAWVAEGNINERSFDSYEEAKIHVKSEYMAQIIKLYRGSGRDRAPQVIESTSYTIEDTYCQDETGQQYSVRVHGVLAGTIWLSDDDGWTLDGESFQDDWRPVARELATLTRRDLVA